MKLQSFYASQQVFITGSTGFLGKALIEKLLRASPPKKIYCLIRSNKKQTCADRLNEMLNNTLFDTLKKSISTDAWNALKDRLRVVEGDMMNDEIVSGHVWDANGHRILHSETGEEIGRTPAKDVPENAKIDLMWAQNVTIFIHMAATVGFQETLDYALKLNSLGAYRLVKWAEKNCPNTEMFCHTSTCYVNSNQKTGTIIKEKMYPLELPGNESYLSFAKRIIDLKDPDDIKRVEEKMLKRYGFPNTYTFSKSLAERILIQNRGKIPVCIYRPSVITSTIREPVPGWVDGLAGPGGVLIFVGLGMLSVVQGNPKNISDVIPVDLSANSILVCIPYAVNKRENRIKKSLSKDPAESSKKSATTSADADVASQMQLNTRDVPIFHCGTSSSLSTCTWGTILQTGLKYWQSHPPSKSIGLPTVNMVTNQAYYQAYHFLQYTWISKLYAAFSTMIQNEYHKKIAKDLQKLETKSDFFSEVLRHFTLNEWVFQNKNTLKSFKWLQKSDQEIYPVATPDDFNWEIYTESYCYGLHKYILKEEPAPPNRMNLVHQNHKNFTSIGNRLFNDIHFAYTATQSNFKTAKTDRDMRLAISKSSAVIQAIQLEADRSGRLFRQVERDAQKIMAQLFASPRMTYVRTGGWILRKVWRRLYRAIYVDSHQIDNLRRLYQNEKETGPVVLMPTNRSYLDFVVLSYIFFANDLPIPHVAVGEDFFIAGLRKFFKHSGAFFVRNDISADRVYHVILKEYIHNLLADGCPIEFFVEGTRSRGGKTLHPQMDILSIISSAFFEKNVNNLTILPIHVAYEKVIESDSQKNALSGEHHTFDNTWPNIIKAKDVMFNNFGDIRVTFANPISLADYTKQYAKTALRDRAESIGESISSVQSSQSTPASSPPQSAGGKLSKFNPFKSKTDKREVISALGYQIARELNSTAVIMSTSMIAAIILRYRSGIEYNELVRRMEWLRNEILSRGNDVHWVEGQSVKSIVDRSLKIMSNVVSISVNRTQNKIVNPAVKTKFGVRDDSVFMQLSFYRNQLIHVFVKESIITSAFYGMLNKDEEGEPALDAHVSMDDLIQEAQFLFKLLDVEFTDAHDNTDSVADSIASMIQRNIFHRHIVTSDDENKDPQDGKVTLTICKPSQDTFLFLCSLIWPFIDSYFLTVIALCKYVLNRKVKKSFLVKYVQQNIKKLYHDQQLRFFESCSLDTIENAITTFKNWELIKIRTRAPTKGGSTSSQTRQFIEFTSKVQTLDDVLKISGHIQLFRRGLKSTGSNLNHQHLDASPMILSKL
mmetsp:Transcript_9311/g.34448  ORF Transcript_9311/g.34448 Transcript_9311/m.34448 type:complete len:1281 (-) Transcript_9311:563-4405(-)|eukprot:CAMPEP_0117437256 /NCGR_PEP_ID=MMETSP0759-20121206/1430_1 /TAXON_ID=63605 /ORGANISM="Percolomonas cosmopolitus, Strain WS" /LENGTH=1280 /DNA_ID=CAMNT_0005228883 /DNA_START=214 /DNA_END=4056 /DNA_ORIENTATION=-